MKARYASLLICFSAILIGQSCSESSGYGSSNDASKSTNQEKIPYSELPEKERPESLFVGRFEKNLKCLHAVKQAETENPAIKECYKHSGLFFSPLATVCSTKCFDHTIKAAKAVASDCDTHKSGGNSKDLVFTSWSIAENAKIYCALDGKSYCVRKIKDFEMTALQRKKGVEPSKEKKQSLCKPCIKDLYELIKSYLSHNVVIPRVYYDQPQHLDELITEMEKMCDFHLNPGK